MSFIASLVRLLNKIADADRVTPPHRPTDLVLRTGVPTMGDR